MERRRTRRGDTNFQWTVLVAAGEYLQFPAPYLSLALNSAWVVAFAFAAVRLLTLTWPIAGLCVPLILLSPGFIEFTTSGLKSAPAALTCGLAALLLMRRSSEAWAPLAVLIASLLRPDQALLFAPLGILALIRGVRTRLGYATMAAAGAFGVYWLCRWNYYGALFPNTFYAKSGDLSRWGQGAFYLVLVAVCTGLGIAMLLQALRVGRAAYAALHSMREPEAGPSRALLFAISGVVLYLLYTAKVGGDFMHLRFGLTPFALAMVAGEVAYHLSPRRSWRSAPTVFASILALTVTPEVIRGMEWFNGIAHERLYYPIRRLNPLDIDSNCFTVAQSLRT